jgi:hypothetical protein
MHTKEQGLEQLEKFLKVDGKKEVVEGPVTYYQPQQLRAAGALIALGVQIAGFRSRVLAEETKWRKEVSALIRTCQDMNDVQAETLLKAAKLGWELESVLVPGNGQVTFNLKSPGGSKAKVDLEGKFVR